jgi:hypothetical protein
MRYQEMQKKSLYGTQVCKKLTSFMQTWLKLQLKKLYLIFFAKALKMVCDCILNEENMTEM